MKTILIIALDGVMDSSLAITLDTLRVGQAFLKRAGKPHQLKVLTVGHKKSVRTGAGLRLTADLVFSEALSGKLRPDWIIIPGSGLVNDEEISARFLQRDVLALMELLRSVRSDKVKIAASCSSVFLLAQTGLLEGRQVTMTWWLAHLFRARFPNVKLDETRMLARDGQFLTAGSAFSQLDVALAIVADTMGANIAHLCSRYLLIDQRPSQARYMMHAHVQHSDPTVVAAERWVEEHMAEPISVGRMSSELAVSPKTLSRRIAAAAGVSPVKFIQRRRLLHAVHLLETTAMGIDSIAMQVGYQDGTALRKLIKREFDTTPGALR